MNSELEMVSGRYAVRIYLLAYLLGRVVCVQGYWGVRWASERLVRE